MQQATEILLKSSDYLSLTEEDRDDWVIVKGHLTANYYRRDGIGALIFIEGGVGYHLRPEYEYFALDEVILRKQKSQILSPALESYNLTRTWLDVESRIFHFLWITFSLYGQRRGNLLELSFCLTHEAIAMGCATTRVTTTKTINELEQQGYLITRRKQPMKMTLFGQIQAQTLFV